MPTKEIPNVMTISLAAKFYEGTALTSSAIRRLVRSGEIPSRKVGAKYLITDTAIKNWLNAVDTQSAAEQAEQSIRNAV